MNQSLRAPAPENSKLRHKMVRRISIISIVVVSLFGCVVLSLAFLGGSKRITSDKNIELRPVSREATEDTEFLSLRDTTQRFAVAKPPILTTEDFLTASRSLEQDGKPLLDLRFSRTGADKIAKYTQSQTNPLVALVIDGQLFVVRPLNAQTREYAKITGLSLAEVESLYFALTTPR